MRYKRGEITYECVETKFRQALEINNLIKWAQIGDWLCTPVYAEGVKGPTFIAQPEHFYKEFVLVGE